MKKSNRTILLTICSLFILSCVSDNKKNTAVESETTKKVFEQPEIESVSTIIDFPQMKEWYLDKEFNIDGINPMGVAYLIPDVYVSDTINEVVLRVSLEGDRRDTILKDNKVFYLNQRISRLIMPIVNKDSIFVFRGSSDLYKFKPEEILNRPTCFDGFKINDFVVCDQGNNRLVRNMGGEYSVIGSYGSNEGEFDKPTCVHFAAGNLYVTDTGNSRVQIFSMEGEFLDSFGKADGLISPTAMSSDGKYLFVLDESSSTIFVYTPKGDLLYKLDQHFSKPTDIYFTRGTLYVADKEGAAIKILRNKLYDKAS